MGRGVRGGHQCVQDAPEPNFERHLMHTLSKTQHITSSRRFNDRAAQRAVMLGRTSVFRGIWLVFFGWFMQIQSVEALDPNTAINQYAHQVWQAEQGLPQNSVQALAQTPDGFVWIGTQEGLVAFDGFSFRVFDKNHVPGMRNMDIRSLATDFRGTLWAGNGAGQVFGYLNGQFRSVMDEQNMAPIAALLADSKGDLWIGTQGNGLWRLPAGESIEKSAYSARLPSSNITTLLEDHSGNLWVGTRNHGLARISHDTIRVFGRDDGLPGEHITALMVDSGGTLWIGTEINGCCQLRHDGFVELPQSSDLSSQAIASFCLDPDQNVWIGTTGGGLNRVTHGEVTRIPRWAVSHQNIGPIMVDEEQNLWIGTLGGGLNRFSDVRIKAFGRENGLPDDMVWVVCADPTGGVWVGTQNGGVAHLTKQGAVDYTEKLDLKADASIFLRSRDGSLWIGTQGRGLTRLRGEEVVTYQKEENAVGDDFIMAIVEDTEARLWIGTASTGVWRFDGRRFFQFRPEPDDFPSDEITDLLWTPEGILWIGTAGGLIRWTEQGWTAITEQDGLIDDYVSAIHLDGDGTLWIGSYGSGLTRIQDGICHGFSRPDGLLDDTVFKILEDDHRTLWLSSNRGIFSIPIRSFETVLAGTADRLDVTRYGPSDGMKTSECNHVGPGSGTRTPDGIMWFPTLKGAVRVDPDTLDLTQTPPKVHIQRVVFDGNHEITAPSFVFPPGSSDFEFHFTSPCFRMPDRVRFRFKLSGYDPDWTEIEGRRVAYYSSLPPGTYQFVVTAARDHSGWADPDASFSFTLKPRFYQRPVFFLALALAAAACAFGAHRFKARAHQKRQAELEALVHKRIEALDQIKRELVLVNQELAENARLSGMAEIASGVLHNIANALNSAGTSVDIMGKLFREPTSTRVINRIVDLLRDHQDHLGHFLTHDERGRKLPNALVTLSDLLEKNRHVFRGEFDTFRQQMHHIEEIVRDQKDRGWAQRSQEIVDVNLLIKNALHMNARRLERLDVDVTMGLSPVPLTSLNPSDFLQVVGNLIKNACDAIEDTPANRARRLEIRTLLAPDGHIHLHVADSGPGIDEAHVAHLFQYGFTTKKEGHGFGLHYSARLVEQMNGIISVKNGAPDMGAIFTVSIPVVRDHSQPTTTQPTTTP